MTEITPINEFKRLMVELETEHKAFEVKLSAHAPALVADYEKLADLAWRALVAALEVEKCQVSNG